MACQALYTSRPLTGLSAALGWKELLHLPTEQEPGHATFAKRLYCVNHCFRGHSVMAVTAEKESDANIAFVFVC